MSRIEDLFNRLDEWRHLPAYQLERRADIFFSLYLPDVIKQQFGVGTKHIIPEFPIRIGEIYKDQSINKSFKIDYFIVTDQNDHFILVELKTDAASRSGKQDWYLQKAKKAGMHKLIAGIIKIRSATKSISKYNNLMDKLELAGLVSSSGDKYRNQAPKSSKIDVMYIQPTELDSDAIIVSLGQFAKVVRKHSDKFSQRFADSLDVWNSVKPGDKVSL